jgi:hypothetical protein
MSRKKLQPVKIQRPVNQNRRAMAISQGGLDLWLEQTPDFLAGRQCCV